MGSVLNVVSKFWLSALDFELLCDYVIIMRFLTGYIFTLCLVTFFNHGFALKCWEGPQSLMPGGSSQKANLCYNRPGGLDISPVETDCGDKKTCYNAVTTNGQSDGSKEVVLKFSTCVANAIVPDDSELQNGCQVKKIPNTSTEVTSCYCKEDLCNKEAGPEPNPEPDHTGRNIGIGIGV